jgi:glycerate 2-kinase
MRILLAPQEFKGSLTAVEAVEAMAVGVLHACPAATIDRAPIADGGPGTVAAVVAATGGELRRIACRDALRRPIEATYGLIDHGTTAVIESAAAAGLTLLRREELDALHTSTEGVGDLVCAALDAGATRLIIGLGGTATNDGGTGMARALGVRLLDSDGRDLEPGGAALSHLARVDVQGVHARLGTAHVTGATDVRNPLCGSEGASAVFGPQKGATPDQIALLDAALSRYAEIVERDLGLDVRDVPGAGAAGGLGAALLAFCGATLSSGFDLVAQVTNLEERIAAADLVITGEGRLDGQSIYGKTTVGVARIAARHNLPVVALCGGLGEGWQSALDEGLTAAFSIVPGPMTLDDAHRQAVRLLGLTAEQVTRLMAVSLPADSARKRD